MTTDTETTIQIGDGPPVPLSDFNKAMGTAGDPDLLTGHKQRRGRSRSAAAVYRARRAPRGREEGHRGRHPRRLFRSQGQRLRHEDNAEDRRAPEDGEPHPPGSRRAARNLSQRPRHLRSKAMNAVDMSAFIAAKSDQLNADDLMDAPRTITITKVTAQPDAAEQPVSIHYEGGEGRPWKPCKTMRRILVGVWGKDASQYVGRSMTLYRDDKVAFGGLQVGGIRVSHMSHIDGEKTVALMVTRGRKAPFKILPLKAAPATEDAATKWANGYVAKLGTLTTLDAVNGFADEKAGKLAELEKARPDLHKRVKDALVAKLAEYRPSGPSDEPDPQTNDLTATLANIANAADDRELAAIEKDTEADRAFLSPEQLDALDEAFATKRAALREGATSDA